MLAEFGVLALILAFVFAVALVVIPGIGLYRGKEHWINLADYYVAGQFVFIAISWFILTLCFLRDDFSVLYVLANSSRSLPIFYKICAVWGGHEGSMLLWVSVLSFWMLLVSLASQQLPQPFRVRVMIILGLLSIGLILFLLTVSNPFLRQFQDLHSQGRDLNPLLQDPGFLFHPPMLYMGYVGFSVAFAMAIAALWLGKVEDSWAKWTRPWTLAAWCCLTTGITLGSWWAYRELGWGGWWFWDPVENASFMPWLAGTALIHSLAVTENRSQFKAWTLLLAITAFSLSLIGTFLVRSGVLTSVHAFAVDPQRGMYILFFLMLVIGGSLLLFALRAHNLQNPNKPAPVSRESALLINNILLATAMLTVLMGTVYPLIIDGLGLGKLSVGAPYFNTVFVPLMLPLLAVMGFGIHLKWDQDKLPRLFYRLGRTILITALAFGMVMLIWNTAFGWQAAIAILLALWVLFSMIAAGFWRIRQRGITGLGQGFCGMLLAHLGVVISIFGIAVSTSLGQTTDVRLKPGDATRFAGYNIAFMKEQILEGPNYKGTEAVITVSRTGHAKTVFPQKRIYNVGGMAMTDSAIDVTPFRDIYVALGEPLPGNAWSVRLYYKPFVRWIWAGGFVMFLGGLLSLCDRRYYRRQTLATKEAVVSI